MDSKNKTKIYVLLALCLIIIVGFWLYSFKLNMAKLGSTDNEKKPANGLNELKNSLLEAFKQHPLNEAETENKNKPIEELTNKIAEEIKNQNNWQTYRNEKYNFEFKYPQNFVLSLGDNPNYQTGSFLKAHTQSGVGDWSANVIVSTALPQNIYPKTNFNSAWLTVAYDPDIANLSDCQELNKNETTEKMIDTQIINGDTWYKGIFSGAALGSRVTSKVFHTLYNNICYEVSLHLATANIANFDPSLGIKAVDENEIWTKLTDILSTFKFIDSIEKNLK